MKQLGMLRVGNVVEVVLSAIDLVLGRTGRVGGSMSRLHRPKGKTKGLEMNDGGRPAGGRGGLMVLLFGLWPFPHDASEEK